LFIVDYEAGCQFTVILITVGKLLFIFAVD